MSKFLESTFSSSKFFILVLSPWTLISGNVCFEFFSVPSVISMSSGAVFLSVSLCLIMFQTLLWGGLHLAIFIHIFKNKTCDRHLRAVAEFGFWFSMGAGCYVGTLTCPFSERTQFSWEETSISWSKGRALAENILFGGRARLLYKWTVK